MKSYIGLYLFLPPCAKPDLKGITLSVIKTQAKKVRFDMSTCSNISQSCL